MGYEAPGQRKGPESKPNTSTNLSGSAVKKLGQLAIKGTTKK